MCMVCDTQMTDPDDFFALGHLTDDQTHPLHQLNWAVAHLSCLPRWSLLRDVQQFCESQVATGAWRGRGVQLLIDKLKAATPK